MFAKCHCMYCQGPIEFDLADFIADGETATERTGQKVTCPHCGRDTVLSIKKALVRFPARAAFIHPADGDQGKKNRWLKIALLSVAAVIILAVIIVAIYESQVSAGQIAGAGFGLIELTIGVIIAIVGFVLAVFWIVFPWLMWNQSNQIIELLKQIEQNTRPAEKE